MKERIGQEKTKMKFGVLESTWSSDSYLGNLRMPNFIAVFGKLKSNPVYTEVVTGGSSFFFGGSS